MLIEVVLPTVVQYVGDQFHSTGYVMQIEVVPDSFSECFRFIPVQLSCVLASNKYIASKKGMFLN